MNINDKIKKKYIERGRREESSESNWASIRIETEEISKKERRDYKRKIATNHQT